jgi:hypothetical protein
LIDATVTKFRALSVLPPQSKQLRQIGNLMAQRMQLAGALKPATGAALSASIVPGLTSSTIVISNPTSAAVLVPITGINWAGASSRETYGNQPTSKVQVSTGASVTITGAPAW